MAQRNTVRKSRTKSIIPAKEVKAEAVSDTVLLMLQINTTYKDIGKVTGNEYVWRGAGSVLPVDRNDVEHLLVKNVRRGCCGAGNQIKPVFVEV